MHQPHPMKTVHHADDLGKHQLTPCLTHSPFCLYELEKVCRVLAKGAMEFRHQVDVVFVLECLYEYQDSFVKNLENCLVQLPVRTLEGKRIQAPTFLLI